MMSFSAAGCRKGDGAGYEAQGLQSTLFQLALCRVKWHGAREACCACLSPQLKAPDEIHSTETGAASELTAADPPPRAGEQVTEGRLRVARLPEGAGR